MERTRTGKEKRQSNFELLRLIAMIMIVASHYAAHGVEKVLVEGEAWQVWLSGSFINRAFTAFLNPGGEVGVALLFMITGYFQIRKKNYSLKKIITQCLFYSLFGVALLGAVLLFGGSFPYMDGGSIITFLLRSFLMPVSSTLWWFVAVYVFLMLFSPVLNRLLKGLNRRGFFLFLLTAWGIWYGLAGLIGTEFALLQKGFFFYSLGAFIRLYRRPPAPEKAARSRILLALGALLGWAGSAFCFYRTGMLQGAQASLKTELLTRGLSALSSMVMVTLTVWCAFNLFRSLPLGCRDRINRAASATFGIYLIHDSLVMRPLLWYGILKVAEKQYPSPWMPLYGVLTVAGILLICGLADLMRQRLAEPAMLKLADRAEIFWCSHFTKGESLDINEGKEDE